MTGIGVDRYLNLISPLAAALDRRDRESASRDTTRKFGPGLMA
jgi:hypothetical protein